MLLLRTAAVLSAAVTVTLNAKYGFEAAKVFELAVLFAVLNATLDTAKCLLIGATVALWRHRAYLLALLSFLLFPPLFLNSVWNAVSQVAVTREDGKARAVADSSTRARAEADHRRLIRDLNTLMANPTYAATSACAQPKSTAARSFCATVEETKSELTRLNTVLTTGTAADPEPQVTLLATASGWQPTSVRFVLATIPVLLAELLGAFGFVIAASAKTGPSPDASQTRLRDRLRLLRPRRPRPTETLSVGNSGAMAAIPAASSASPSNVAPIIQWKHTS